MKYRLLTYIILLAALFSSEAHSASKRMILIEETTNAFSESAATRNPVFQEYITDRLNEFVPLVYHIGSPSDQDPMYAANPSMNDCRKEYYNIFSPPLAILNGFYKVLPNKTNEIEEFAENVRGQISPIEIEIIETKNGSQTNVSVFVKTDSALSGVALRVAATEIKHEYSDIPGGNGETIFPYIARKMLPDCEGTAFSIAAGESRQFDFSFSVDSKWIAENMYIVAFVQDDWTFEVLQAASTIKETRIEVKAERKYLRIDPNDEISVDVKLTNREDAAIETLLEIDEDNSILPSGWSAELSETSALLSPKSETTVTVKIKSPGDAGFALAAIKATPLSGDGVLAETGDTINALSTKTLYGLYSHTNESSTLSFDAFRKANFQPELAAVIPLRENLLDAYPMSDFNFVFLTFDLKHSSLLAKSGDLNSKMMFYLLLLMEQGKKAIITSEASLSTAFSPTGSDFMREYFAYQLGLFRSNYAERTIIGSPPAILTFPLKGYISDHVSNGVDIILNQYDEKTHRHYVEFTDLIELTPDTLMSDNPALPFLYYDDDPNRVAGVRIHKDNDAKIAYLSFGFEAIKDSTKRVDLMRRILEWIEPNVGIEGDLTFDATANIEIEAYPNPFAERLRIKYYVSDIPVGGVRIDILDANGRLVENLALGASPGERELVFDAAKLSSGAYFVVVRAGESEKIYPVYLLK